MSRKHLPKVLCYSVLILVLLTTCKLQALQSGPGSSSLKQFFDEIVRVENFSLPPENKNLNEVEREIPGADPGDISKALPSIFTALSHRNEQVRWCAISALITISGRPDSTELLKDYIGRITDLWNATDAKLESAPAAILNNVKLETYPGIMPLMLQFVQRTDRAPQAQSSALFVLAKNYPSDPRTIEAVVAFLSRPLDVPTRINTLQGVSLSRMNDHHTRKVVIEALDDSHEGVKLAAIQAIRRMGPEALEEAEPRLAELSRNSAETQEVRAAAKNAINKK